MLKRLFIKNYALIESLEIDFQRGFSVITGETGAGKSILLGALGAVLGERITTELVKNNTQNCVIEAVFDVSNLEGTLASETLDGELILRRVITPAGKSRCFVNDEPVKVAALKAIKPRLIDIHSQHQNLLLHESDFQLFVVDCLSESSEELSEYQKIFQTWREAQKSLADWRAKQQVAEQNKDYWQFQLDELFALDLQENELETLERMQKQKDSLVELQPFASCVQALSSGNQVSETIELVQGFENKFLAVYPSKKEYFERLENLKLEIESLGEEFLETVSNTDIDEQSLLESAERLAQIQRIQEKHHLNSEREIFHFQQDLEQKLNEISDIEAEVRRLEALQKSLFEGVLRAGAVLSEKRKTIFEDLQFSLEKSLKNLGIPFIQFSVAQTPLSEPSEKGLDVIEFLFAANKGESLAKLSEKASGGEISRVMLVLKLLIANKRALPTIIFDEIDTGISGKVAEQVGELLKSIGQHAQVFAITHLPQVASKGDYHFLVEKNHEGVKTESQLRLLTEDERVNVIAQMLSGETVTDSAKEHAQQLLF